MTSKKQGTSASADSANESPGKWQEGGHQNLVKGAMHFVVMI
jgi:hypothetical protein